MAIQVVATGAITLVDLNDARVLQTLLNTTASKVQVYNPNTVSYTPSWSDNPVTITPELTIAGDNTDIIGDAKTIKWYRDGVWIDPASLPAGYSIGAGTGKPLTINQNVMGDGIHSLRIHAEIVWTDTRVSTDLTVEAEIIFQKSTNGLNGSGSNAITAFVSNESVTFPASTLGVVSSYSGIGTDIYVYDGTSPMGYVAAGVDKPGIGEFTVAPSGTNITVGAISAATSPKRAVVAAHATPNMTQDTASISYVITAKTSTGAVVTITKTQSFSKSKAGADATTYSLNANAEVILKNAAGTTAPSTLTFTGLTTVGSGTPSSVANGYKFVIDTSVSGAAFSDNVASPTTGASANFTTNVANLSAVRCRIYPASVTPSTTNWVDQKTVYVVADGVSTVTISVWGPNGLSTRNGASSLTAQCDVYDGITLLASNVAYLWYKLSGGSWTALTAAYTGYNTKTLTITPAQISGQSSFKCVATYSSKSYEDTITLLDYSDPIVISLIPAEGNIFRNSVGTKNVTCKVFKANVGEIDTSAVPAEQIYEYRWFLNNADGTPNTDATFVDSGKTYKTGKTIQVLEGHVTGTANLSCELWTKS
jgi:hypothetical protein